jgi:hypothetical protein
VGTGSPAESASYRVSASIQRANESSLIDREATPRVEVLACVARIWRCEGGFRKGDLRDPGEAVDVYVEHGFRNKKEILDFEQGITIVWYLSF